jgi:SPP1 gp7 family putative phage head morphogenesis protein
MVVRKDSPQRRLAFERVRNASTAYARNLRKVAHHIGQLVNGFDHPDQANNSALQDLLEAYARILKPWARATAQRMLMEISRRDTKAWEQYARQMGQAIRTELATQETGRELSAALERQVELITSLPLDAARRVHELTQQALSTSVRPSEIAAKILETGEVTKSRADLIARTEVARTASNLTQVRAESVGSTHYIWRTVRDRRVRESHEHMEGRVCAWADPPEVEPGQRYHAGCIYNCRCYPEPIVPED